jgi:hypothetical protein
MLEAAHENDIDLEGISLCLEIDGFLTNMIFLLCLYISLVSTCLLMLNVLAVYFVGSSMMLPFSS